MRKKKLTTTQRPTIRAAEAKDKTIGELLKHFPAGFTVSARGSINTGPDYERMFFRCKRALVHLWGKRGKLNTEGCEGCREVYGFMTVPGYRGDVHHPVGVEGDRHL